MSGDRFVEEALGRAGPPYYGKYRGTVVAVDPGTLRIKAKVSVLDQQTTGWCEPCVPYAGPKVGLVFLPEVGSGVWLEFERGDLSYPIWVGCYWRSGEVPPEATPQVKAVVTHSGHKLLFDDEKGTITASDAHGNKVTLAAGGITLERGGKTIVLSDAGLDVNDGALEVT